MSIASSWSWRSTHFKITERVLRATGIADAIYLHCLPALHDLETEFARQYPDALDVSAEVFEGPQSRVFEQAENRMHTIKSLMVITV
jgi:ornithine carbamoyltransferase